MTSHLDRITATDGYLFIRLEPVGTTERDRALAGSSGDADRRPTCELLLKMFDLTDETKLRAVVGLNTIFAVKTQWGRAVVALPTGHKQTKSANRVLRRILKRLVPAATRGPGTSRHAI